jgi:hypothetical protein
MEYFLDLLDFFRGYITLRQQIGVTIIGVCLACVTWLFYSCPDCD